MLMKDYQLGEKPREKAKLYGIASLSDAELIAIILNVGTTEISVIDLANQILNMINDEGGYDNITMEELMSIKGVGEVKAIKLLAVVELAKRVNQVKKTGLVLESTIEVYNYLKNRYNTPLENFIVLYFNKAGRFISEKVYNNLHFDSVDFDINELIRWGIKYSATNVIIAHNHPSGNFEPSYADIVATKKIATRLKEFDINLLDHLVFSDLGYVSMRKEKMFE